MKGDALNFLSIRSLSSIVVLILNLCVLIALGVNVSRTVTSTGLAIGYGGRALRIISITLGFAIVTPNLTPANE